MNPLRRFLVRLACHFLIETGRKLFSEPCYVYRVNTNGQVTQILITSEPEHVTIIDDLEIFGEVDL